MIAALRWLLPRKKAIAICLRCGAEFAEPEHTLCPRCRELASRHG